MKSCPQARHLFGPYWDDEVTRGERDWLETHLAGCEGCRTAYDRFTRTLEAAASLPRPEMAPDLADRVLAEARRRQPAPDVIALPARPQWQPLAAAAGFALVALTSVMLLRGPERPAATLALEPPVAQPRLVSADAPGAAVPAPTAADRRAGDLVASVASDSLFDHSEDVEFILDPVQLRRGRAHTARLPEGVQGEQAVISF